MIIKSLLVGLNGQFHHASPLLQRFQGRVYRGEGHRGKPFMHGPVDLFGRGVRPRSFQVIKDGQPLRCKLEAYVLILFMTLIYNYY